MTLRARLHATTLAAVLFALVTTPGSAADRVVLYEEGTNWACVPSAVVAPYIHQIMLDFGSRVAAVKFSGPSTLGTMIEYTIAEERRIQLRVYDLAGRMVRELVEAVQTPSRYRVAWDGRDQNGQGLECGVYFCRLATPGGQHTMRMVLAR